MIGVAPFVERPMTLLNAKIAPAKTITTTTIIGSIGDFLKNFLKLFDWKLLVEEDDPIREPEWRDPDWEKSDIANVEFVENCDIFS